MDGISQVFRWIALLGLVVLFVSVAIFA